MSGSSDMEESVPVVLVAGATQVGKSTLIKGITGSESSQSESSWFVKTKYYTATLSVREADGAIASTSGQPEALVLVFSLKDPSTLSAAQAIAGGFDLEAVEVKVLCGTHAEALLPGTASTADLDLDASCQPQWFQQALDWSIENGFEFVACCPALPLTDGALTLDGDKQGLARVVEVMHAHTWPNLTLLSRPEQQPSSRAAPTGSSAQPASEAPAGASSHPSASAVSPPSSSATPADNGADGAAPSQPPSPPPQASTLEAAAEATPPSGPVSQSREAQEAGPRQPQQRQEAGGDDEAEEAERMLDGLERLMEEMRGHKARLTSLPDAERREQAAAMALKMMELLGLDEGEDEDDDDDDEEGGSGHGGV